MNNDNNQSINNRYEDDYFNVVSLPMEQQHATTQEERKLFFENLKNKVLGQEKKDIIIDKPLTTDVIGRGYPPKQEELNTIKIINNYEKQLLNDNPSLKPNNSSNTKYYIVENGKVYKVIDEEEYFELDTDKMEWNLDPTYMGLMYDTYLKFSELKNFRDYYIEKEKEENRGLPR